MRAIFELVTPTLDRDRLYSVLPIHLHDRASKLEHQARDNDAIGGVNRDAFVMFCLSSWLLQLGKSGQIHLRPKEVELVYRALERQRSAVWTGMHATMEQQAEWVIATVSK